jgi:hypothetical protein
LSAGYPHSPPDVGAGYVPERLPLEAWRISDSGFPEYDEAPAERYRMRWGIESLFGALKSCGFNLEDTRLQDPERISRLLALLAIAFTWAFVVGVWQATVKELKLKKHGYPPKSVFRLGLNMLCRLVTNLERFNLADWRMVIKLLSCT